MGQFLGRDARHIWGLLLVLHHVHSLVHVHLLNVLGVSHLVEASSGLVEVTRGGYVIRLEEVLASSIGLVGSTLSRRNVVGSSLNLHVMAVVLRPAPSVGLSCPPLLLLGGHVVLHLVVAIIHINCLQLVLSILISKQVWSQVVLSPNAAVSFLLSPAHALVVDHIDVVPLVHVVSLWREDGRLLPPSTCD